MSNLLVAFLFGMSAALFLVALAFRLGSYHGRAPLLVPVRRRLPAPRRVLGYTADGRPIYAPPGRSFQKRA